jgi:hypothetical protein
MKVFHVNGEPLAKQGRLSRPESGGGPGDGRTGFQSVADPSQGTTLFCASGKRATTRMFVNLLPRSRQAGSLSWCIVPAELC